MTGTTTLGTQIYTFIIVKNFVISQGPGVNPSVNCHAPNPCNSYSRINIIFSPILLTSSNQTSCD